MKEQGPASSFKRRLSSARTAPIKRCPDQAFLHIRNSALLNEDQLNPASFYLGSHNRRDNKFPLFFPGNYRQNQLRSRGRKPSPITHPSRGWIPAERGAPSCPRPHRNPAGIRDQPGPPALSHCKPTRRWQSGAPPREACGAIPARLWPPFPGLPRAPHSVKNCTPSPRGHRCNQEIQLNNPGPLLSPTNKWLFFLPQIFPFPSSLSKGEKKKKNKPTKKQNPKLENNRKKRRGGQRKERNCSPFFSVCAG